MPNVIDLSDFPNLERLVNYQLKCWPEHVDYLRRRFNGQPHEHMEHSECLAELVLRLAQDSIPVLCEDYRWMCDRVFEEELHFRRTGRYRLKSFKEALSSVYNNTEFMCRYMNGLLLSQILWSNHTNVSHYYVTTFLGGNRDKYRHLEVGPGHGFLLYFAARDAHCSRVSGWDISEASLEATKQCLEQFHITRPVRLENRDIFTDTHENMEFDSIVISEVLEHLEHPIEALTNLRQVLHSSGRLFVNVPINSPAPDHIYLLREPEEALKLVTRAGFDIIDFRFFPATGCSEARARKQKLTISVAMIATPTPTMYAPETK